MKKLFTIIVTLLFLHPSLGLAQDCGTRYLEPTFENIVVTQDVPYGSSIELSGATKNLKFDFYEPEGDDFAQRPLVILAHGGTFLFGDENDYKVVAQATDLAHRGYVCASINYRLADVAQFGASGFPDLAHFMADEVIKAIHDMKAAIRFFRKDAATENKYKIDPDQIFIGGNSAGAVLSINLAYADTYEGFDEYETLDLMKMFEDNGGLEGNSGNEGYPTNVNGIVAFAGAVIDKRFIQAGEEPVVCVHNTGDPVVPYGRGLIAVSGISVVEVDGSGEVAARCEEIGVSYDLLTIEKEEHDDFFDTPAQTEETMDFVADFLYDIVVCKNQTVGITQNLTDVVNIQLAPNPTQDNLQMNWEQPIVEAVQIHDVTGKIVYQQNALQQQSLNIATQNWASGIYFIQLIGQDGQQSTHKVIVE